MTRVLITGCGGFIGSHLTEFLLEKGHDVWGTYFSSTGRINHISEKITMKQCDLRNRDKVRELVADCKPDIVFHLAAQSFVVPSWEDMENTMRTNSLGTAYLLEALEEYCHDCKILVACSSAEYGLVNEDEIPIKETAEFRPSSPYAVSKVTQDMISYLFWKASGMKIIRMRLFNITGPRKKFDACSDFAKGIADIEAGKSESLKVGNTESLRDITDVRDAVNAIELLSRQGTQGEVYNICTGNAYKIGDLLNKLVSMSDKEINIEFFIDSKRKIDDPLFVGDNTKITSLGWKPEIPIDKTLSDLLEYWRNK